MIPLARQTTLTWEQRQLKEIIESDGDELVEVATEVKAKQLDSRFKESLLKHYVYMIDFYRWLQKNKGPTFRKLEDEFLKSRNRRN